MDRMTRQPARAGSWRALAISLCALAVPVAGAFWFPASLADYEALLWLLALIPAFLLANDRGWRGISTALAAGMAVLSLTYATVQSFGHAVPPLLFVVVPTYLVIALGAGWLAERVKTSAEQEADSNALTDPLTGLGTREYADLFLEREFALTESERPLVAVLFEFDQFERFVGRHGRHAGDGALRAFATLLRQMTRRTNVSARYGRAEFLSLLVSSTEEGAVIYAERVRELLREAESLTVLPSMSIGIGCYTPSMGRPSALLAAAREALRQAQRDGGDRLRVHGRVEPGTEPAEAVRSDDESLPVIPLVRRPTLVEDTEAPPPLPGAGRSAFVFHSLSDRREALATVLREQGFRVTTGAVAGDRIRPISGEFDLVVVEVAPDQASADLVQEIRARFPATRLIGVANGPDETIPGWILDLRLDGHGPGPGSSAFRPPLPELMEEAQRLRETMMRTRTLTDEVRAKDRETRNAIAAGEARFRTVVENIREVIFRTDAEGRWTYLNPAWSSMTGFEPGESLGRSLFDDLEAEDDLLQKQFEQLVAGRLPYLRRELRCRTRRGDVRWVEARAQLQWESADGEPGTFGTLEDVTERREAEQALRRSEEYFRSLIEQSSDIMAVLDRDARIRYASPAVERVLGYPVGERVGRSGFENIHPEDMETATRMLADVLREPDTTAQAELRVVAADGEWRHLELTIRNLTHLPGVDGLVVNARDVTDRRNTERALRESEELLFHAQKMDAIGRLAGGVAHDFNNLLTVVRGHAELLLADLPADDGIRDDLHEIEDAARRATGLTRQLLAFSRKQVMQPRALDLNEVVQDMERMVGRLIGEHITLVASLSSELASIRADRSQIEQVILNLVVNARDAMPAGGRLTIETALIDASDGAPHPEVRAGRWVMLRVSDTGVGMDAAISAQAFEPFFTTKPPGQGTGLGLSTVYGVVGQSGGHVWVESVTDDSTDGETGTRMNILLPAVELVPEVPEPRQVALRAPGGEETVALVEDEKSVRELAYRILSRQGYRVIVAEDGQSGLQRIAACREPIHLLLTDVVMPLMGGRELAERVSEMRPGIRVLYMSGYAEDAVVRDGALAPGSGFLEKPFSPDLLLARVRELLDAATPQAAQAER